MVLPGQFSTHTLPLYVHEVFNHHISVEFIIVSPSAVPPTLLLKVHFFYSPPTLCLPINNVLYDIFSRLFYSLVI